MADGGPSRSSGASPLEIEIVRQLYPAGVNPEDLHPSDQIGIPQRDLSIETAGAQQLRRRFDRLEP